MICSKCGQEFADDVKFCTNCGTELTESVESETEETITIEETETVTVTEADVPEEPEQAEQPVDSAETEAKPVSDSVEKTESKPKKEKRIKPVKGLLGKKDKPAKASGGVKIGAGLAALVLLLFIPAAVSLGEEEYRTLTEKSVLSAYKEEESYFVLLANGDKVPLEDSEVRFSQQSADRTAFCYQNENDELIVVKDGKSKRTGIEDARGVKVSVTGDTLLYYTDCENTNYYNALFGYDSSIEVGTLHLYFIKKGKDVKVAEEVVLNSAVLSPNGKTVAYVTDYEASDDFRGYYSVKGKKPVEVGKEKRVFAIADKGAYVYYTDDDRIYVQKKKKEPEKLASDIYSANVLLNAECTEMLFVNEGKTYITIKGGEKQKISGKSIDSLIVNQKMAMGNDAVSSDRGTILVTYTGVETMKEKVLYSSSYNDIFYLKENLEAERLASDAGQYALADDGEHLVYIDDMEIVKVDEFEAGGRKADLTNDAEARSLYTAGDLKYIYYLNRDKELYCIKGKKAKWIADDVTDVAISADGKYCYYVKDGETLCYSAKGKKGKELFSNEDANVTCDMLFGGMITAQVVADGTTEVYRMDGKDMELFHSYEEKSIEELLKEKYGLDDPLDYFFD